MLSISINTKHDDVENGDKESHRLHAHSNFLTEREIFLLFKMNTSLDRKQEEN